MSKLNSLKPHDSFFKRILSDERNLKDILRHFLPEAISKDIAYESVKLITTEKVKGYKQYRLDLAVECKIGEEDGQVYFVFEHKSYPDMAVLIQIASYMTAVWDEEMRKKGEKLTPIIPVIFYHGDGEWKISPRFAGQFGSISEAISRYAMDYGYVLVDLRGMRDEEIEERSGGNSFLAFALLAMRYAVLSDISGLKVVFRAAIISLDREELFVIFDYIMHTREEQLDEFIEVAKEVGGENMVQSLAERLINEGKEKGIREGIEKGIQKGIEKGIQKGAIKGKQAALIRLLNKKFGLTKAEERRIESVEDESKIDEALELVLTASEKAEVMRALK